MDDITKLLDGDRITIETPNGTITVIAPTRTIGLTRVKIRTRGSLEPLIVSFNDDDWTVSAK